MELAEKCPICDGEALPQNEKPVKTEGRYSRVYKCPQGHVWRVKTYFKGKKRVKTEIIKGGGQD